MSAPTKEQIAAAKAFTRNEETGEQLLVLRKYDPTDSLPSNSARILLAALEAAEADSARLRAAIDEAVDNASGRWCEWGERAEESFRVLRAARKEAQP